MTIADKLTLLASSKEALRVKLGLPKNLPFSEYYKYSYPFDPLILFKDGEQGAWLDPSDKSTLFQDVAGTVPVTKDGDPVALIRDKSGNNNHATQSVSAARPTYQTDDALNRLRLDGVDDGFKTGVMALTSSMDCFVVLKIDSATFGILFGTSIGRVFGYYQDVGSGLSAQGCGTNVTHFVDGVQVYGGTSVSGKQLYRRLDVPRRVILEIRNLDLTTFNMLEFSSLQNYMVSADIGDVILCQSQSDTTRTIIRNYLAAKAGITL